MKKLLLLIRKLIKLGKFIISWLSNFVGNDKKMSTTVDTLSRAIEVYNDRYQDALDKNSKRELETFKSVTNQINTYFDVVYTSVGENAVDRAETALDSIVDLLNAQGISISEDVSTQLSIGIIISPNNILIPTDSDGTNPDYTNAFADIDVTQGAVETTSSWTYTIFQLTNCSATIASNRVTVTDITADTGNILVRIARSGYSDIDVNIAVKKTKKGEPGQDGQLLVDDVTIGLNVSNEAFVKDDGIGVQQIDVANVFEKKLGGLIEYKWTTGSDLIVYPTTIRRNNGESYNVESGHSGSAGENNFVLGKDCYVGPQKLSDGSNINRHLLDPNTAYNPAFNRIFLNSGEGDVTSLYTAGRRVLVLTLSNSQDSENAKYYIGGVVVSSTYTGTQTTVDITPDWQVDAQARDYINDIAFEDNSNTFCIVYDENTSSSQSSFGPLDNNIVIGSGNAINGSNNVVIGKAWALNQADDVFSFNENVLIGVGGMQEPVLGTANLLILRENTINVTEDSGSSGNIAIGTRISLGDDVKSAFNMVFGTTLYSRAEGGVLLGTEGTSRTNGEIVISSGGNNEAKKSMFCLRARTTSTSATLLESYGRAGSLASFFVDPQSIQVETNSVYSFTIDLMGVVESSGSVFKRRLNGVVKNNSGTTVLIGTVNEDSNYDVNELAVTAYSVTADDSTDELKVSVTPSSGSGTEWFAWCEIAVIEY